MPDNNEKLSIDELEESNVAKKRKSHWQMLTLAASIIAIISLIGIWYVSNERAFLQIENNKLRVEAETLKEELSMLQTTPQNDNPVNDNNSPQTEITQTGTDQTIYVVKPGDTLAGISISLFGTESYVSQIAELNGINAESLLQVGQKLKTPKKPGD